MKVTTSTQNEIQMAMSAKGMNRAAFAQAIGKDRSYVSRLLSTPPQIAMLKPDVLDAIQDALGVDLMPLTVKEDGGVYQSTPTLRRIADAIEDDPEAAILVSQLASVLGRPGSPFVPDMHQKDLIKLGAEITRIVHAWEENADPHYAKIGAETLSFLRQLITKRKQ